MDWKQIARDYFSITRKERTGIIVLLVLIAGAWLLPAILEAYSAKKPEAVDSSWIAGLRKLDSQTNYEENSADNDAEPQDKFNNSYIPEQREKIELFDFDPNTLSVEGWQKLGLREKTIKTIQNYVSKGGRFRTAADLLKIYGLRKAEYELIEPYVKIISVKTENDFINYPVRKESEFPGQFQKKLRYEVIDINAADTTAWISLPGIGSKLAVRIVSFREKLGGFYAVDQIREVYGIQDSTFQKISKYLKLENINVKTININTATKDELKVHPYIKWNLANAIVEYRNQKGNYSSLEGMKQLDLVTPEVFSRIQYYLSY